MPSVARISKQILRNAAWAPAAVLLIHEIAARALGHEPYVDPTMHFGGGVAAAFFFRYAWSVGATIVGPSTPLGRDAAAFGLACVVAMLWEFGEFAADQLLDGHVQRGLMNTMRDLALGASGALFLLVSARVVPTRKYHDARDV